ncbi:MAG: hypothetical protein E7231_14780 [Cellulosilyticum sp.]|nr:hypothetical protein [Cellulosilyticum sp.]
MSLLKKVAIAQVTKQTEATTTTTTNNEIAEYTNKIFDTTYVHTIDIQLAEEDLQDLLENATEENFY